MLVHVRACILKRAHLPTVIEDLLSKLGCGTERVRDVSISECLHARVFRDVQLWTLGTPPNGRSATCEWPVCLESHR